MKIEPYERTAQYYETDQMAVIHHANYIKWLEEARTDFLRQCRFPYAKFEEMGIISPVLEVHCEYKKPVVYDETVLITVKVTKYKGITYYLSYEITGKKDGVLKARCETKHCLLTKSMQPIRIKRDYPELHTLFQSFLEIDK